MTPIEEAEFHRLANANNMLQHQLIEIMKNNGRLAEENKMFREFITKIGGKIKEETIKEPDFKEGFSDSPEHIAYRTFQHYDIDRFRFVLDNPSGTIIEMWEKLMENGVLDTYDREHNKVFMRADISKLDESDYFYLAYEAARLSRKKR